MRARIVGFEPPGLVLKARFGPRFTVAYGEILAVERLARSAGLRLHTRVSDPIRIAGRGKSGAKLERDLRARGVRVVDCWGALLTPTLDDFQAALALEPSRLRQSSDNG